MALLNMFVMFPSVRSSRGLGWLVGGGRRGRHGVGFVAVRGLLFVEEKY